MIKEIIIIIIAYLIGTISPAYFLGKIKGKDLRKIGTRNLGSLNAYRQLGAIPAAIVLVFDIIKGAAPVIIGAFYGLGYIPLALVGSSAVIGHDFPFYLNFHGGKGNATLIGLIAVLVFALKGYELLIAILITVVIFYTAKVIVIITQKRESWA